MKFEDRMKDLKEFEERFKADVKQAMSSARAKYIEVMGNPDTSEGFKQRLASDIYPRYKAATNRMREDAAKVVASYIDKTIKAAQDLYATAPSEEAHRMALMLKEKDNPGPGEVDSAVRCAKGNPSALLFIASIVPVTVKGRVPDVPTLEQFEAAAGDMKKHKLYRVSQYGDIPADTLTASESVYRLESSSNLAYTTGCTNINLRRMIDVLDALSESE